MKVVKQRTGKIDYHKCDVFMILSSFPAAYLGHRCMLRACDLRLPGKPNANTHSAHAEIYCLHHCHVSFCQAMLNLMSMLIQNTNLNFVWLCTFICSFMCAFFFFLLRRAINLQFALKYMSKTHAEIDILQEKGHGHSSSVNVCTFLLPTSSKTYNIWLDVFLQW